MQQRINQQEETGIGLYFAYLLRSVFKNLLRIVMCACIGGIFLYIFLNEFMHDTYSVSMNLSVIARDNSAGRLGDYNMKTAVSRSINVLNSDTLKEQIKKTENGNKAVGTINAIQIGTSNMITLTAAGSSSEEAFRTMKAAIETYPALSGYFESGYLLKNLDTLSADSITAIRNKPVLYAAAGTLFMIAAGAGIVLCTCLFGDKVYGSSQAERLIDAELLGSLHYIKKKTKSILISLKETDITYIEQMDRIATKLQRQMEKQGEKSILITSLKENEGKSTVAANIALNLAKRGKRVLLIDTDLRKPSLYKIFDMQFSEEKECAAYLKGDTDFSNVLQKSRELEFYYIFQRSTVTAPDKLLSGKTFRRMLKMFEEYMDYIILDTPPVGVVCDAEVLAGVSSAALIVVKQDEVRVSAVNDAVDTLEDAGTVVAGCVLNAVRGERSSMERKGRYSKYSYGYNREVQV